MLAAIRRVKGIFAPMPLSPVENWAIRNSTRCSADEIISAAVVESFAKDFDNWTGAVSDDFKKKSSGDEPAGNLLKNEKKGLIVRIGWRRGRSRDRDGIAPWWWHPYGYVSVNNIRLDHGTSQYVISSFRRIVEQTKLANEIANKTLEDQKRLEEAWNLAENLLGMKRNEHGALVPVKTVTDAPPEPEPEVETVTPRKRRARASGCIKHSQCHSGCESCCYCEDEDDLL